MIVYYANELREQGVGEGDVPLVFELSSTPLRNRHPKNIPPIAHFRIRKHIRAKNRIRPHLDHGPLRQFLLSALAGESPGWDFRKIRPLPYRQDVGLAHFEQR